MEKDQARLDAAVRQGIESIDMFLDYNTSDGACEEGPAYWDAAAGKLYDFLQILYDASSGKFAIFDNPRIKRMGEFISRSYIGDGFAANFAAFLRSPRILSIASESSSPDPTSETDSRPISPTGAPWRHQHRKWSGHTARPCAARR